MYKLLHKIKYCHVMMYHSYDRNIPALVCGPKYMNICKSKYFKFIIVTLSIRNINKKYLLVVFYLQFIVNIIGNRCREKITSFTFGYVDLHSAHEVTIQYIHVLGCTGGVQHRVLTSSPLPLCVAKADRNHLNKEITPLLPTGKGERYGQTISNLGHAALLRRCLYP